MVREAITLPSWGSTVEDPNLPELRTVVILGSIYQAGTVSWADARPDPDRGGNFRAPSRRSPAVVLALGLAAGGNLARARYGAGSMSNSRLSDPVVDMSPIGAPLHVGVFMAEYIHTTRVWVYIVYIPNIEFPKRMGVAKFSCLLVPFD